ncbi:hypothetical protein SSP35_01_01320 [Streptomyces sp. NBRC 110611]|nr:hypothetical protein SSP35_01_01320 [Streptomyces sp. NBRC 110611]
MFVRAIKDISAIRGIRTIGAIGAIGAIRTIRAIGEGSPELPLDLARVGARRRREATAAFLLAASAVLYNAWVLEFPLPTGLDPRHSYVSELYAADQPFRPLFGGIEILCAVLTSVGAVLARGSATGPWARAGWLAVLGLGLSSLADVLLPMSCAPSLDPGCEAVHPWHTVTSALAHFFVFASMGLLSLAGGVERPRLPLVRRWGPRVLGLALPAAVGTVGPLFGRPGWHGIPQRTHLALVGVWFALLAAELARSAARYPTRYATPEPAERGYPTRGSTV